MDLKMLNWHKAMEEFRRNPEIIKIIQKALEGSKKYKKWLSSLTEEQRIKHDDEQTKLLVDWILTDEDSLSDSTKED